LKKFWGIVTPVPKTAASNYYIASHEVSATTFVKHLMLGQHMESSKFVEMTVTDVQSKHE
jgi:hypothetical protein